MHGNVKGNSWQFLRQYELWHSVKIDARTSFEKPGSLSMKEEFVEECEDSWTEVTANNILLGY